ncbi:MAG: hypothetical protein SynsKO_39670 [Synoicihabitans sp.]
MKTLFTPRVLSLVLGYTLISLTLAAAMPQIELSGELRQWHKVTLTLDGPQAAETDTAPNPFTDYNFEVTFTHESGEPSYVVPGYFAADGNAAETSATTGNKWRAHLSPDKTGRWNYLISFREGIHAAIGGDGSPLTPFHGKAGHFKVSPSNKKGRDFRAHGRLEYVGKHHLRFAGSGEYFLKAGADAPETLLAYADFDGTEAFKPSVPLKTWEPHRGDWRRNDPTWQNGKGRGLIGAINYLEAKGMNAFSFLTYNAGGDGDNVWPFVSRDAKLHYDCSKLDQWGILFDHGTELGMFLHFKLTESENSGARAKDDVAMDEGETGPERKLYLRELIARYGHALALNWNLGEENTQTVQQMRDMAQFIHETDPYGHLIVNHTRGHWEGHQAVYPHLLGDQSALTGVSMQTRYIEDTHFMVQHWLEQSAAVGKPWVVSNDEQDIGATGVPPDPGYTDYVQVKGPTVDEIRRFALWGTLMAGGAGVEYYFGYTHPQSDLDAEDWRSRSRSWDYARYALEFFDQHNIPVAEMTCADELVRNPNHDNRRYCLAQTNALYLVYLPFGGDAELDLRDAEGKFNVSWFNPRRGGKLMAGPVTTATGGDYVFLGLPPADPAEDWLVVISRQP